MPLPSFVQSLPLPASAPSSSAGLDDCGVPHQWCYVLKDPEYDPRAAEVQQFLQNELKCKNVRGVCTAVRYCMNRVTPAFFTNASQAVLSQAPVDDVLTHKEFMRKTRGSVRLPLEYLPGLHDSRAQFASEVSELTGDDAARPYVHADSVLIVDGTLQPSEFRKLKKQIINPTERREASMRLSAKTEEVPEPKDVPELTGFRALDAAGLSALLKTLGLKLRRKDHRWLKDRADKSDAPLEMFGKKMGLAMTLADLQCVVEAFTKENRDPTETELKALDTYWSDHCRHTTFTTELLNVIVDGKKFVEGGKWVEQTGDGTPFSDVVSGTLQLLLEGRKAMSDGEKPFSLMDVALFAMKNARKEGRLIDLHESKENNAATIIVPVEFADGTTESWLFEFKNETHNHPSKVEPEGGAATAIGGCIRDPLSGRSYPFMAMRISATGDPRVPNGKNRKGQLSQQQIAQGTKKGSAGYGNQIGVPTILTRSYFHPGNVAKPLELAFVAGAVRQNDVQFVEPKPGDVIVVVGGRTGRDGQGGATGSSKAHDQHSTQTCAPEVQKGDPTEERKLVRFLSGNKMIKRCNDFGAGGYTVACGELADGVDIDLDKAPLKYSGLNGTEIALSESQERMAVVIARQDLEAFLAKAENENLEATAVGHVTEEKRMVMRWRKKKICDLDRSILSGGWAKREANAEIPAPANIAAFFDSLPSELQGKEFGDQWLENLRRLCVCGQQGESEAFDSTVGANTVIGPYQGIYQKSPSDAAVATFPAEGAITAMATSYGYDPDLAFCSPFHGALYAVVDSLARLVATGASYAQARLTIQNYFEKLGHEALRWGKPLAAQLGALRAQLALAVEAIGGKDSMSGSEINTETGERIDVPPAVISFAIASIRKQDTNPACFQTSGSTIVYLPTTMDKAKLPDWKKLQSSWAAVHDQSQAKNICAARAVHAGGVAAAISEMSFGNGVGAQLNTYALERAEWFSPRYGSLIIEVPELLDPSQIFNGVDHVVLGKTGATSSIHLGGEEPLTQERLLLAYEGPLEEIFPSKPRDMGDGRVIDPLLFRGTLDGSSGFSLGAKPKATVLFFPGTNCEIETARALERSGARTDVQGFVNLNRRRITESIRRFVNVFDASNIVVIPGGFSAADEPDGSGKFIAAVLRNPAVRAAYERFIQRGGLIAGICNGFQGLINACAFSDGGLRPLQKTDPFLTHNTIGRYISRKARMRVISTLSPWMSGYEIGAIVEWPIAHGEGRLIHLPHTAFQKGLVPLVYVGLDGIARMRYPDNPNGSEQCAVGLTDATGQSIGVMPHPERSGDDRFFCAAVRHF